MVPGNKVFYAAYEIESEPLETGGCTLWMGPNKEDLRRGGRHPSLVIPSIKMQSSCILSFLILQKGITTPEVNWRALSPNAPPHIAHKATTLLPE